MNPSVLNAVTGRLFYQGYLELLANGHAVRDVSTGLPTEEQLSAEIQREMECLGMPEGEA